MQYLFMVMIGCRPAGRHTEQHDIFFGIGQSIGELIPAMKAFWPETKGKFHIDAWRKISLVDGFRIEIMAAGQKRDPSGQKLFFINLGGYKPDIFDEFHYKMVVVAKNKADAIRQAKATAFYRHTGFKGATSHIDDQYGIDVDDLMEIKEALNESDSSQYSIFISPAQENDPEDALQIGYFKLSRFSI